MPAGLQFGSNISLLTRSTITHFLLSLQLAKDLNVSMPQGVTLVEDKLTHYILQMTDD